MCGIAGVRRLDGEPVRREILAEMAARLFHRGPDATGIWAEGSCRIGPYPAVDHRCRRVAAAHGRRWAGTLTSSSTGRF